jgi:ABC-type bacteriocin/lantibiotic exporter with double-glycine peptidase domain
MPFMKPLHRRQSLERTRNSELTSMATDIVAGLRILRGIGGERTFGDNYATQSQKAKEAGISAGIWQALIDALGVLFSGVFLVLLLWVGAHEVLDGRLTVGDLVAFLGVRAVHGHADPDLLRVRAEDHPRAGIGAQGDRHL